MRGRLFLLIALVIAAMDVIIPFVFLKNIPTFTASYLFWSLLTLIVIVFGFFYLRTWRNKE